MKLYTPTTIKEIQARYGFKFSKSLGQNFLTDKNIIDEIIEGSQIGPEDTVIEIGPGIGVITYELCKLAKKVIAIELDTNLIPILQETLSEFDNIEVLNQDVLKTDLIGLCDGPTKIIGNLPYYITTPIIMKILEDGVPCDSITVMMQKEVADRVKASPGGKDYGALTVAVQYYSTVETLADVPKEVFVPRPSVDSTVLKLNIRDEKAVEVTDRDLFFKTVKAGFGQRRKTLNNSLMGVSGITKEIVKDSLAACGIDPVRRAETLSIEEFGSLANEIEKRMK